MASARGTITKLLVANRGEIAARIMRTAREMDIATVAVYSDPDAEAPFVAEADEAVRLPGATPGETYLRGDRVIDAARATEADAIHPGYGFLSENADFARACAESGIRFVGPPPEAIESMGSKIAAKELMTRAGVPVLPGVVVDEGETPDLGPAADEIGFPLLVKASYGGGGRGMRIVRTAGELESAVESARREAASAFGNGAVFLERYVERPRHVEVQIFGDEHGSVLHLFERECSIQRRYQKIIEESPSPAVDESLRGELGAAAVAAGKAIGYVGAGTVEFVLDPEGRFYFLEVNTRLQVEHPVTELVTGLDLVRLQLSVAEGDPLPEEVLSAQVAGHSIEARLYAEDVPAGFLPASGTVHRLEFPAEAGVRIDSGVADGSLVSVHYDPMLAKVIAHGRTRDEARRRLARSLARARLHGVTTNRDLLVRVLREPDFQAGRTDTGYLDRHDLVSERNDSEAVALHVLCAAVAEQARRREEAAVLGSVPSGWRNVRGEPQTAHYAVGEDVLDVSYEFLRSGLRARVGETEFEDVVVHRAHPQEVDVEVGGVRRRVMVNRVGDVSHVDSRLGATALTELDRFPDPDAVEHAGSLLAPMPGTVVRVAVEQGQQVRAGEPVVVLEAMKMEHTVNAPHDGVVAEVRTAPGEQVDTGAVLAVVEEE